MALFKRKPRAFDFNPSGTPILDGQTRYFLWWAIAKVLALPLILFLTLWWFGQPALLFDYNYRGSASNRSYINCRYLAPTGWKTIWPAGTPELSDYGCPAIAFVPIDIQRFLGV